jgi:hypothetical protein
MSCSSFTKALIIPLESGAPPIVFQYNPYEFHIDKDIKWKGIHTAGRDQPLLEYGSGEARRISIGFEVSKYNNSDFFVIGYMQSLLELSRPLVKGRGVNRPSRVQLIIGASYNETCVVDDIKIRMGSHKGQTSHHTYLADPVNLLPKEGHILVRLVEYY